MKCPYCSCEDTRVADSRLGVDGAEVRRRRHCSQCDERFTTYERMERRYPRVLKSNGLTEAFNEQKVRRGIMRSLEKLNVEASVVEHVIHRICDNVSRMGKEQIKSSIVGEEILRELIKLDEVAYVRFASVYRRFNNVSDFTQELKELKSNSQKQMPEWHGK